MKKLTLFSVALLLSLGAFAQTENEKGVELTMLNYIEGFYEGDTTKLIQALHPKLNKYGFWKDEKKGIYHGSAMSYDRAIAYAKSVKEKEEFASPEAPKKVEIYEVQNKTACGKVTAWWGTDYVLLANGDDGWKITHVLWQSVDE